MATEEWRGQRSGQTPFHNMPFRRSSNSRNGLRTPPPSPQETMNNPKSHPSRFQLPWFWKWTSPSRSPINIWQDRPQDDYAHWSQSAERSEIDPCPNFRPFRAVQNMTNPFPLRLPASPALSESSTNDAPSPRAPRSVPLNDQTLRALRSEWRLEIKSPRPLAPLPSPVFSDLQINEIAQSSFAFRNPWEGQPLETRNNTPDSSYEEHNIVSSYCDDSNEISSKDSSPRERVLERKTSAPAILERSGRRRDQGVVSSSVRVQQPDVTLQHDQYRTHLSEADWLAGNISGAAMGEEWPGSIPARRVQVVQHSFEGVEYQEESSDSQIVCLQFCSRYSY